MSTKKNGLKLFETKTTTLTWGVNIIKVEPADDAQLDLLTVMLGQRLSDGWYIDAVDVCGPHMIYTLIKNFEADKDEPWKG